MDVLRTLALFVATAIAEIAGCYLPYLWLRHGKSAWLLVPGALSLALFAWLLSLHPTAAGRTYAAYGGAYVASAVLWLWWIDDIRPDRWDIGSGRDANRHGDHRVRTPPTLRPTQVGVRRRPLACSPPTSSLGQVSIRVSMPLGL